jgi:hypothetical protein
MQVANLTPSPTYLGPDRTTPARSCGTVNTLRQSVRVRKTHCQPPRFLKKRHRIAHDAGSSVERVVSLLRSHGYPLHTARRAVLVPIETLLLAARRERIRLSAIARDLRDPVTLNWRRYIFARF